MIFTREATVTADADGRTVTVQLLTYDDPREVDDGEGQYRESFLPGSLELADRVVVRSQHGGDTIGHADTDTFDPAVPSIELRLADDEHDEARRLRSLIRNGTIGDVSIEFEPIESRDLLGVVERVRTLVRGIAFAFRPAHQAPVLAVRSEEDQLMPESTAQVPAETVDTPNPVIGELERSVDELKRDLIRVEKIQTVPVVEVSPLDRFRSYGEYALEVYSNPDTAGQLTRALADQITTNNPGVIPQGWVKDVKGIVDRGRPSIEAWGSADLPANGMDVNWPYYDGNFAELVAAQADEKTEITTVTVDLGRGTAALGTYAGGSDISYQLITRSDPSYLDAYLRIMAIGYSAATDKAFAAQMLVASATGDTWVPATGTLEELRGAYLNASIAVQAATGQPASFAVCATDVFAKIAPLLPDDAYPLQNVSGAINAATLAPRVSGLPVIHDPFMTAATHLVSNSMAASWHGNGPFTASEEDVANLGRNVAVWGMGVGAPYLPAGIVEVPVA